MIQAHQPDLTLVSTVNNKVLIIDVAVPWDSKTEQKEQEKHINIKTNELNSGDYVISQWI